MYQTLYFTVLKQGLLKMIGITLEHHRMLSHKTHLTPHTFNRLEPTPWSTALKKLTVAQTVKLTTKFPAFYEIQTFVTLPYSQLYVITILNKVSPDFSQGPRVFKKEFYSRTNLPSSLRFSKWSLCFRFCDHKSTQLPLINSLK